MNAGGACILAALVVTAAAGRRLGRRDRTNTRNEIFRAGWQAACDDLHGSLIAQDPSKAAGWLCVPYEQYEGQVLAAEERWQ